MGIVTDYALGRQLNHSHDIDTNALYLKKAGDSANGTIYLQATSAQGNNLVTSINAATNQIQAVRVSITDIGGYFVSTDVEGALQEIGYELTLTPTTGSFVDNEIPSGFIDGINKDFTTAFTFIIVSLKVYLNGVRQKMGVSFDYTITGANKITFAFAPRIGSQIIVDYRK